MVPAKSSSEILTVKSSLKIISAHSVPKDTTWIRGENALPQVPFVETIIRKMVTVQLAIKDMLWIREHACWETQKTQIVRSSKEVNVKNATKAFTYRTGNANRLILCVKLSLRRMDFVVHASLDILLLMGTAKKDKKGIHNVKNFHLQIPTSARNAIRGIWPLMEPVNNKILSVKPLLKVQVTVKHAGRDLAWLMETAVRSNQRLWPLLGQALLTSTVFRLKVASALSAPMATTIIKLRKSVSKPILSAEGSTTQLATVHNAIKASPELPMENALLLLP